MLDLATVTVLLRAVWPERGARGDPVTERESLAALMNHSGQFTTSQQVNYHNSKPGIYFQNFR